MEKINIAELLKDCPKGMELDCTMYEDCTFKRVCSSGNNSYPIHIQTKYGYILTLTKYGQCHNNEASKCIIFLKGKTTWEGFQRPFKDGDIISDDFGNICIFKGEGNFKGTVDFYCGIDDDANELYIKDVKDKDEHFGDIFEYKLASVEERQKLFKAIKDNGYGWNAETKSLEQLFKPKFKVGDKIKKSKDCEGGILTNIYDDGWCTVKFPNGSVVHANSRYINEWELVSDKFDFTTLKPFDKVLVRYDSDRIWHIQLFANYNKNHDWPFLCMGYNRYKHCIPYKNNEHLLGTPNDCSEYYKIWEK